MKLSEHDYRGVFLPSYIRKKSSFGAELWSVVLNKLLPNTYAFPDVRFLLYGSDFGSFSQQIDQMKSEDLTEQNAFINKIREDAIASFNQLASIINGEQQNLYVYDRFQHLGIENVFLSGVTDKTAKIPKIETQLCKLQQHVQLVRQSFQAHGTTVHLTYRIEKLNSDLIQACDIITLCKLDTPIGDICNTIKKLARRNLLNKGMWHFISSKTKVLTQTIVEHNSVHGGKYIAGNLKEYLGIFKASLIGGLLIAVFALFKIRIESWGFSLLAEGILFGLNYALCFVLVDLCGGIIATKQPAMTAHTLLTKLTKSPNDDALAKQIANVFIDVSKSQFMSLVGNLSVAFFLSLLISYLFSLFYQAPLVSPDKGDYLLHRNNMVASGSLFYAAIAGLFLSVSGFIAGYMDNAVLFYKMELRAERKYRHHPKKAAFSNYVLNKAGKFSGSISLGMLLGIAGAIGMFSGIPFDIRHVAFSSAHIAYGSYAVDLEWVSSLGGILLGSIFAIGMVNFVVSFVLTLLVALQSSTLNNREIIRGFLIVLRVSLLQPWLLILPIRFGNNVKSRRQFNGNESQRDETEKARSTADRS